VTTPQRAPANLPQRDQQAYFDRVAEEFNAHYADRKHPLTALVDRVFRQGMVQRFEYVTSRMDCGPGHYMAALAGNRGAAAAVGLDFAPAMIEVARRNVSAWGLESSCRLATGDFMTYPFDEPFDTVLAIGYYDYVIGRAALDAHFRRMLDLARRRVVASFPARWSFKTLPRWAWLTARGCPVQFYSTAEIRALMARMGVRSYKTVRMSGTILLVADTPAPSV
jgi:SAM-dependent methyltransferase